MAWYNGAVAGVLDITERQRAAVDAVARAVVRFSMTVPTVMTLESMRPLSYVGSQWMHLLSPIVTSFLPTGGWEALAELLEHREGLDVLLEAIEARQADVSP